MAIHRISTLSSIKTPGRKFLDDYKSQFADFVRGRYHKIGDRIGGFCRVDGADGKLVNVMARNGLILQANLSLFMKECKTQRNENLEKLTSQWKLLLEHAQKQQTVTMPFNLLMTMEYRNLIPMEKLSQPKSKHFRFLNNTVNIGM